MDTADGMPLDNVKTEFCFHHTSRVPDWHALHGYLERDNHFPTPENPQITATLVGARILGVFACEISEVCPSLASLDRDPPRKILGFGPGARDSRRVPGTVFMGDENVRCGKFGGVYLFLFLGDRSGRFPLLQLGAVVAATANNQDGYDKGNATDYDVSGYSLTRHDRSPRAQKHIMIWSLMTIQHIVLRGTSQIWHSQNETRESALTTTKHALSQDVPVLDESRLIEVFGDDLDILIELRDLYIQHCPPLLDDIRSAYENGDSQAMAGCAHSLKGASATYGAMRVSEISRNIEIFAKEGKLTEAGQFLDLLQEELAEVVVHIGRLSGEK